MYKHQLSSATTEKLQGLCLLLKPDPETAASPTNASRTKRRRPQNSKSQSVLWHQKCKMVICQKNYIISQTAETREGCGNPFRPSLTTSPRHRPVTMTHPSQMHSTPFIHGLKCRMTHLHKNCPHLPTTRHSVCLQPM